MANDGGKAPLVFFDLEATGLIQCGVLPDIIQIAAVGPDDNVYNRYILPEKPMTASAIRVTGLRVKGDRLLHLGNALNTVSLRDALTGFLDWLRSVTEKAGGRKPLLLAYSGTRFDVPVIRHAFSKTELTAEARQTIGGFADVFFMAKATIPKREVGSYSLQSLARRYIPSSSFQAHNATQDAKALKGVFQAKLDPVITLSRYTTPY